jgi:alanyl-tRNA synthetase
MTSKEIRQQFLDFFASKEHTIVPSAPVVPLDDPTLMFTNAGMNQFKDVFLGAGSRPYTRVADTQKCIRAGGKHNDLDDVGQDAYHHTFFEMLGNWSFGDYFKREAIAWAWELLTEVWGIEKSRLHATYFEGDEADGLEPDLEAAELWKAATDINPDHVHPGGKKDNFWEMGETGPCGPCSEIHIDLTPDESGITLVNAGDPRVIELWNLVFIQFNRDAGGKLTPLPAKHVDTGMGFERLCAVLNGRDSNYETDVWTPVFKAIQDRTGAPDYLGTLPDDEDKPRRETDPRRPDVRPDEEAYKEPGVNAEIISRQQVMVDVSYRIIADHARCLTFALTDGAVPSNEGRGYVLRRILRRAVRYGRQYFDMHEPFLCDLVAPMAELMGGVFPELKNAHNGKNVRHVADLIREEEESFGKTLDRGIRLFGEAADHALRRHHGRISGEDAFRLHDTYGFPIDLTELMAEERGLKVDIGEYERLMEEARARARAAGSGSLAGAIFEDPEARSHFLSQARKETTFLGWETTECEAEIQYISRGERFSKDSWFLPEGEPGILVLNQTPFYAEKGGQVADRGRIVFMSRDGAFEDEFIVEDVQEFENRVLHVGRCTKGSMHVFSRSFDASGIPNAHKHTLPVRAIVDPSHRTPTMQNHTATHVLNWALREVLGGHIDQKGSLVDPEKTRFDFSHPRPVTIEELMRVEELCNEYIQADRPCNIKEVEKDKALAINTLRAVFGEQYPDRVRVISIGGDIDAMVAEPKNEGWMKYSVEFCGGTHCRRSGEIECFALISEEGVAKGIRRVVGISGEAARKAEADGKALLDELRSFSAALSGEFADKLRAFQQKVEDAVIPVRVRHEIREHITELQKQVKKQEKAAASDAAGEVMDRMARLLEEAEGVGGVTIVVGEVPQAPPEALRSAIDWIRNKTEASAVLLTCTDGEKVTLVAGMSKAVVGKGIKAGDLIKEVAPLVGGRGGGRPDMAQGGGNNPGGIPEAVDRAKAWIAERAS